MMSINELIFHIDFPHCEQQLLILISTIATLVWQEMQFSSLFTLIFVYFFLYLAKAYDSNIFFKVAIYGS